MFTKVLIAVVQIDAQVFLKLDLFSLLYLLLKVLLKFSGGWDVFFI